MKTYLPGLLVALLFNSVVLFAQYEPVVLEAEEAALGADYETLTEGTITYITPGTDYNNTSYPGTPDKVATFTVNFAQSGEYKLFARVRVGAEDYMDDSFYYGFGFGEKDATNDNDWITCNGMVTPGYSIETEVVMDEGASGSQVWKWVALSDFTGGESPITFTVPEGELSQTFQIGAREDGFDFDKIAFGFSDIYYTVANLNNAESGSTEPPAKPDLPPAIAANHEKFLGSCYAGYENENQFLSYWNQVTPENAGKWGSVERNRDQMNWGGLDDAYELAKENGLTYKHHVLIWGSQQPNWISNLSPEEQLEEIEEWMAAVAERYPDIDQIEVVNEPLEGHAPPDGTNNHADYADALGGKGTTGWDWIIKAFELARNYFPNTQLLINEYGIINSERNTNTYVEIIKLLNDRGLIDGICFQAHGFSMNGSVDVMKKNLDKMAQFGLPIYPSELDIDGETDKEHLAGYQNYFKMIWDHEAVEGVTLWGYLPQMWRGDQGAYLVQNGVERPVMKWLKAYINNTYVPAESIDITAENGITEIEVDDELQLTATLYPDTATIQDFEWKVNKPLTASIDENGLLMAKRAGTIVVTASSIEYNTDAVTTYTITIKEPVGVNDLSWDENIRIYPNPTANGNFTIEGTEGLSQVAIFNINGKQVANFQEIEGNTLSIQLDAPKGIYVVQLSDKKQSSYKKISIN